MKKYKFLCVILCEFTLILLLGGCVSTPNTVKMFMQFGMVYLGHKDGNRIIIPNFDHIPAYDIFRKTSQDTDFVFIVRKNRPIVPLRSRIGGYGIDWTDDNNSSVQTLYKAFALNDSDSIWFEVLLNYYVPTPDTMKK